MVHAKQSTHLLRRHGLLRGLVQLFNRLLVVSKILLASNEDNGEALAEVQDFGDPLSSTFDQHERLLFV